MGRSKKNWDHLVDFNGNYLSVNSITGVTRLINGSPNDLQLDPFTGLGDVTIKIHPLTTLLRTGDDISRLNNDVGYIKGIEKLDEIGDVSVPSPNENNVLTYDGNEWVARPTQVPDAFLFRGGKDVATEHPEADPQPGWTYVQSVDNAAPLASWQGIVGELVNERDFVMYGTNGLWSIIRQPFSGPLFRDLQVVIEPEDESYRGGHLSYNPDTAAFFFTPTYTAEFPDLDNSLYQPDTYDQRYVRRTGDAMSGNLTFAQDLQIRFLGEGEIYAATQLNLQAGVAAEPGLTLTSSNLSSNRLNVDFWVGTGAPEPGNPGNNVPTLTSRLDSSYGPLFSYYGQVAEDYNIVNKIYVDDLIEDTLEKCLRIDGSNAMKGDIQMDGSDPTIKFNNTNASIRFPENLTIVPTGFPGYTQIWTHSGTYFKNRAVNFYAQDDKSILTVSLDHATADDGYAFYKGQILNDFHLVNKRYVDEADGQVAEALVDLEARVHLNEFNINKVYDDIEDMGFLTEITIKDTITSAPGGDAHVLSEKGGVLTFTIPAGEKGMKGQRGATGPKGDRPVKGDDGIKGDKGLKGQKGEVGPRGTDGIDGLNPDKGEPGTNGTKGQKGQKGSGQKGQKGAPGEGGSGGAQLVYRNGAWYVSSSS